MNNNLSNNKKVVFKTNVNCSGCVSKVTPVLNNIASIETWQVDTTNKDKLLTVEADENTQAIIVEKIKASGFIIEPIK